MRKSTPGIVFGVGVYDSKVLARGDAPHLKQVYGLWKGMLRRASDGYSEFRPSYSGVSVAPAFHHFSDFAGWVTGQIGWGQAGYQLDKDILQKGNRIYSPEMCVFVPRAINNLLTSRARVRGDLPVGVVARSRGKPYAARITVDGVKTELGSFDDTASAFEAYKMAKEANIRRLADLYRDRIDPRAYDALMAYSVEITD